MNGDDQTPASPATCTRCRVALTAGKALLGIDGYLYCGAPCAVAARSTQYAGRLITMGGAL